MKRINNSKMPKFEVGKRVYILNCHIQAKKQELLHLQEPEKHALQAEIAKLYELKEQVLLKLLREGFATIKYIQMMGDISSYCIIRVNRETTFHLPITREVKKFLRERHEEA